MRILSSRPALRWLAPLAFILVITGTVLVATTATAERKLPSRTAEQLLVDVQQARVDGLSGTVIQRANLGIPEIPGAGENSELGSLVSGTHTLRVRYATPDKVRLAVLGTYGETDVITNGRDVWIWSSRDQAATHRTVNPGDKPEDLGPTPGDLPSTPQEAAEQVLAALQPTTTVTTDSDVTVADRAAYELVLDPNDDNSLVGQIRLAVDGDTKMPLRVQIFNVKADLVFEVGYDSVSFTRPEDREFEFNAPPGTKVTEAGEATPPEPDQRTREQVREEAEQARAATKVVGTGWSTVVVREVGTPDGSAPDQLQGFLSQLPRVSGDWGSGRLLSGTAFSAVLTDDGRIAIGAVRPEKLYQALG